LQQLLVRPETALVRPYVVAAILRGITFDPIKYNSFIDLQVRVGGLIHHQKPSETAIG
jgi:phenylalanyl-tRNA synthetase beta chain